MYLYIEYIDIERKLEKKNCYFNYAASKSRFLRIYQITNNPIQSKVPLFPFGEINISGF